MKIEKITFINAFQIGFPTRMSRKIDSITKILSISTLKREAAAACEEGGEITNNREKTLVPRPLSCTKLVELPDTPHKMISNWQILQATPKTRRRIFL